jgi:diguanylate cyclase (GGDEF)-like protein/PAS domain S-box-containing protein
LRELCAATVRLAPEGIIIQDLDGVVLLANAAAVRILGLRSADGGDASAPGAGWASYDESGARLDRVDHPARVALETGQPVTGFVLAVERPGGDRRWLEVDASLIELEGEAVAVASRLRDITDERRKAAALDASEERLRLAGMAGVVLWEWDVATGERWRQGTLSVLGREPVDPNRWADLVVAEDRPLLDVHRRALALHDRSDGTFRLEAGGETRWIHSHVEVVDRAPDRTPTHLRGRAVDVTEVSEANRQLTQLLDSMMDGYLVIDSDWRIRFVNQRAVELLGPRIKEMLGAGLWDLAPALLGTRFEAEFRSAMAGANVEFEAYFPHHAVWYEVRGHPTSGGIAVYFRDVTELRHAATHDPLTGLPNRTALVGWLQEHLAEQEVAVLFLDLDRFKVINDTGGHGLGDLVLCDAAERLCEVVGDQGLVARLGGDEFVVAVAGHGPDHVRRMADEVLDAFRVPVDVQGRHLVVTTSLGLATSAPGGATAEELIRDADAAVYQAKDAGRNRAAVYDEAVRQSIVARLELEGELRQALAASAISAHYQPIFDPRSRRAVGVEALARWHHPTRGAVSPGEFVPVAEETGLVCELGDRMVERALADVVAIGRALGSAEARIWVNVAPRQLEEPGFAADLVTRIERAGATGRVGLELVESALTGNTPVAEAALRELAAAQVPIAIDDFGTGHSSLARLSAFPFHMLKIDRTFVADLARPAGERIVAAIIDLAHAVGALVCAEGVETEAQLRVLEELGVDRVSGFYLARPVALESVAAVATEGCRTLG